MNNISVLTLNKILGTIDLIDIREQYEYAEGHVKTAKNIPMNDLISNAENYLSKGNTYYIICQSGVRSANTVSYLSELGYDVVNVEGGTGMYELQYGL